MENPLKDKPLLVVISQQFQHIEAFIIGNRTGLERLRDHLEHILKQKMSVGENIYMQSDGEMYPLIIAEEKEDTLPTFYLCDEGEGREYPIQQLTAIYYRAKQQEE